MKASINIKRGTMAGLLNVVLMFPYIIDRGLVIILVQPGKELLFLSAKIRE